MIFLFFVFEQEGIALLKAAGKDTLLEMQGLKEPEADKPSINRDSTMQVTAKVFGQCLPTRNLLKKKYLNDFVN